MKSDIDSVEAGVKSFETTSSDVSNLEQCTELEARVGALGHGIREILESPAVCTDFNFFTSDADVIPRSRLLRKVLQLTRKHLLAAC